MTWLTWRQLRVQSTVVLAAAAAVAIALLFTAHSLSHASRVELTGFIDQLQFKRFDGFLYLAGLVTVHSIAPVIGAFWGGPLIARELETGTHRLAWNQSITRRRWLATKLAMTAAIGVVAAGSLSLLVTWWAGPIDRAIAAGHGKGTYSLPRIDPTIFGARGIVAVGYVLFALAVGATVGLLLRRSIPAVALTLIVVVAAEILVPQLLRPHLQSPVAADVTITTENLRGIQIQGEPGQTPRGAVRLTVRAGGPGDWSLANQTVSTTGASRRLPSWVGDCISTHVGPPADGFATKVRAGGRNSLDPCLTRLASEGFRQHVTYQPARHFWSLQLRETGVLVLLAALLTGFCFWRINRDLS